MTGQDETLAIQAAIDAAPLTGAIIQFDAGVYDINIDGTEWKSITI